MNKTFSVYLDAVRFLAAVGVLFSHFVMTRWTGGAFSNQFSQNMSEIGADLVMVFFVLSGFVIALTTNKKNSQWQNYAFSRGTRIYSVAFPAIVFCYIADQIGVSINPAAYEGWWYSANPLHYHLIRGLTFSNEFWISPYRMGTNGPYWSLGYEVWFYILFGCAFYARGIWRVGLLAAGILIAGPGMLLLSVVWGMGVLLHYFLFKRQPKIRSPFYYTILPITAAGVPILLYCVCISLGIDDALRDFSKKIAEDFGLQSVLGRASFFAWNWVVGLLVAIHFWGLATLFGRRRISVGEQISKPIVWLAGASFSIYLVHYPVMQALNASLPGELSDPSRMASVLVVTMAICLGFAQFFERPLPALRRYLRGAAHLCLSAAKSRP